MRIEVLPVDLVIVKDVVQHLPNAEVLELIKRFEGCRDILWVNDARQGGPNGDTMRMGYRPIDVKLTAAPEGARLAAQDANGRVWLVEAARREMFPAAIRSAGPACPQDLHLNLAWVCRFALATCPQAGHSLLVFRGLTKTTETPDSNAL
jgi:hypothetical protein